MNSYRLNTRTLYHGYAHALSRSLVLHTPYSELSHSPFFSILLFWGVTRYLYLQSFYIYTITVKHYSQYDCLYESHDLCLFICLLDLLATCLLLLERNAYTYTYTYSQAMVRRDVRAPSNSTSVEENGGPYIWACLSNLTAVRENGITRQLTCSVYLSCFSYDTCHANRIFVLYI